MEIDKWKKGGQYHANIREHIYEYAKMQFSNNNSINTNDIINIIKKYTQTYNYHQAFPIGISVNNEIAHYTPLNRIINNNDLVTIDFGLIDNEGRITDAAFTFSQTNIYDDLLNINQEALNAAIRNSGPDVRLSDIGKIISEIIDNSEIYINNNKYNTTVIKTLSGHNILPYKIHGSKAVPNYNYMAYKERMLEDEVYAIEPFVTTGDGNVIEENLCNHYMFNYMNYNINNINNINLSNREKQCLSYIKTNYKTLCFSPENIKDMTALKILVNKKIVNAYPKLIEKEGTYVSQFEHNIYIKSNGYELLTEK